LIFLLAGCQGIVSEAPTPSVIPSDTRTPTLTFMASPTPTPFSKLNQAIISEEKLDCSPLGSYTHCVDPILNIEFEYPAVWGEIEAVLRYGGYSGYAYSYRFSNHILDKTDYLATGGRSKDFADGGRGGWSTDFAGYTDSDPQDKQEACDARWNDIFPICKKVSQDVTWMISFPKATYFCNRGQLDLIPFFRIETNLPNNPTISGFVFETSFLSEQFSNQIESDLYSILGVDSHLNPTKCSLSDQQAFDAQLKVFVEKITNRSVDDETLGKLDALTHLAESITLR